MSRLALKLRDELPTDVFTDTEVVGLLDGSPDRRYGLVKRAIAEGDIIRVRRGVYSLGKRFQRQPLNLFELAQKVYAPSYISLESSLSFHNWIPEATYTATSVSLKRSVLFETPVGNFSYARVPKFNFVGVERLKEGNRIILVATPIKALVDYVLVHGMDANPLDLMKSLRLDEEVFRQIPYSLLNAIVDAYRSARVRNFARSLKRRLEP